MKQVSHLEFFAFWLSVLTALTFEIHAVWIPLESHLPRKNVEYYWVKHLNLAIQWWVVVEVVYGKMWNITREKLYFSACITLKLHLVFYSSHFDYYSEKEHEGTLTHTYSHSKMWVFTWTCCKDYLHLADLDSKSLQHRFSILQHGKSY